MRKSIERWAAIDPRLVAKAGPAYIAYLVADAQADIAELAGRNAKPAVRLDLVFGGTWPGLHIRKWDNLAGLQAGTHVLYEAGCRVDRLPPDLIAQARFVFDGNQCGLDAIEYLIALVDVSCERASEGAGHV
ncbi:hypothetical protein [Pseudomonas sp. TMP9]|uniref:hypothetical protein n=1 Tax=Pseudomonas sp. TMP9 TaxID=3133144 RepID=UPI0030D0E3C5